MRITQTLVNEISYKIIGCAIEVHKHLGPGLLEGVYQKCMMEELRLAGLSAKAQVAVPINYKGIDLGEPLRLDILVEDLVIVELKAVETMHPVYTAQGLTYLKLTGKAKTLVINFFTDNISKSVVPLVGLVFAKLPIE